MLKPFFIAANALLAIMAALAGSTIKSPLLMLVIIYWKIFVVFGSTQIGMQ
jgi:hypothetical protein